MMRLQHGDNSDIRVNSDVSVIMPVLNEESHLAAAVNSVLNQSHVGRIEVILALGPSHDRTNEVATALSESDERIRLIENPTGATATALNLAIAASRYPVVVRLDAHSSVSEGYIAEAVATLAKTGADNVGGVMAASGQTEWESAVAAAMTSVIGVGSAAYHVGGEPGPSTSVYLGCFRREALNRVNGFDERFTRAQDWELNHRLRATGGTVWFTPNLVVKYRPRSTLGALARQYFEYGRWRRAVMRSYPETKSLRYLAAPVVVTLLLMAVVAVMAGGALMLGADTWGEGGEGTRQIGQTSLTVGLVVLGGYLLGEVVGGLLISGANSLRVRLLTPIALLTMHLSWGIGFLTSPRRLSLKLSKT